MSSRRRTKAESLTPLLVRVIAAAVEAGKPGHADAMRAYGQLALVEVLCRGVLAPENVDVEKAIEEIARAHLGFAESRNQLRTALARVRAEHRDAIERALTLHESVSDVSHFYAGLAYGITLAELSAGH